MARRPRVDSDTDDDVSREETPASTAPDDSKRARRSATVENTPRPSRTPNGVSSISKRRAERDNSSADGRPATNARFQPGAIVRVKLDNFVTYTSAEFFPGPNLNMVIGPNGTGKSTLVCAICLGLGWGPSQLGRAKEVAEFVKHGCKEATIEIELQRQTAGDFHMETNPVIRRLIKRDGNKSSYTLNGQAISGKQVLEFARSFNIQIDNLCQFLPQDRVVEFAQMNPIELLHSTQQAAAEPDMLDLHENLKTLRKRQKELLRDNRGHREELANLVNRQEMQRVEVEQTRARVKTKRRLDWLERCRPIPLYGEAKKRAQDAKQQQKQLARELQQLKAEVGPTLQQVNAKQLYEREVRAWKHQREQDVAQAVSTCEHTEKRITKLDDKMQECENLEAAERRGMAAKKQDKQKLQQQIVRLQRQMDDEPDPFDARAMNEQVQQLTTQKREFEAVATAKRAQIDEAKRVTEEGKQAIERLRKRSENLETLSGQQASKLESKARDTYKAWQWIQEHRDRFEKEVFGPPMVECSLTDVRMAHVVEALFQENDFRIITVQCQADFRMLQHQLADVMKLHEFSLRVHAESLDQFHAPMPQEALRRLGLDSWALDCIRGPEPVLAMLCSEKRLHQTALSLRDISNEQYDAVVAAGIQTFVAGQTSYRVIKRVEYNDSSAIARPIKPASIWTHQPVDHALKAQIGREISEKKDEVKQTIELGVAAKAELSAMASQYDALQKEIKTIKDDKDAKQHALAVWKALPAQVAQRTEKIAVIDHHLAGVKERVMGMRQDKDKYMLEKAELTIRFAADVSRLRELHARFVAVEVMHVEALSDFETLQARNQHIADLVRTKQQAEKEAGDAAKRAVDEAKKLVRAVQQLRLDGQEMDEQGDPDLTNLLQEVSNSNMSTEELEAEIDSLKASLELTHGASGHIITEYEERARTIEKLRDRMSGFRDGLTGVTASIAEVRGLWEPRLLDVVEKISDAFAASFARIGCAGSVTVFKASVPNDELDAELMPPPPAGDDGNGLDFANWAIHVSVKFRESEPLSLLDSHRQSGGERAVSTIFYLTALQSLSRAPFRVVDEINQGMDPRNERMVHGRMVEIAANGHHATDHADGPSTAGSQYFLITPKLLPGLEYRRGMCVHCIVSGENMPAVVKTEFAGQQQVVEKGGRMDFRMLARRAKALGLAREQRRVDSGVSMKRPSGSHRRSHSGSSRGSGHGSGRGAGGTMDGQSTSPMTEVGA